MKGRGGRGEGCVKKRLGLASFILHKENVDRGDGACIVACFVVAFYSDGFT